MRYVAQSSPSLAPTIARIMAGSKYYLPLARYEQQAGVGLAVRKHIFAERGIIASAAVRKPGPKLSAADVADIARLTERQTRRLNSLSA
mgnify:CR=1 FL=1